MSIDDTKEELLEYGRWASIKANRSMWYQPINHYPSNAKSDPICISLDRALVLDGIIAGVKKHDPLGHEALAKYLIERKSYRQIGREMQCNYNKAEKMVSNTIYMVHGVLIAQNVALYA